MNERSTVASETVIRGGLIATAEATYRADIGIDRGRISVIAERVEGETVIDVDGCIVMPGAIDVHTHFDTQLGDSRTADDYESGSRAAAFGGITTFVNYAFQGEGESLAQAIQREVDKAAPASYLDHGFHPVITRVDEGVLGEFEAIRDAGFTSVKLFTAVPGFQLGDRDVLAVLRRAAETQVLVNVHAEDGALIDHLTEALLEAGATGMESLPKARPDVAEGLATEKLGIYGRELSCPIYFVHLSSVPALEAARRARLRGAEIYIETRPVYLFLDEQCYCLPQQEAQKYVAWPPLRQERDREALWQALASGEIQTYATDHTTWKLAQKTGPELDFASVPGGVANVESMVGMLYSEGVAKGRISLNQFVAATSTNPAKLFGMWPRKGTITVGADADFAVIDPEKRMTIAAERMQSASDFDPHEGFEAVGWPVKTIVRGRVVVDDGQIVAEPGSGELIRRSVYNRP
jgi:dihydropyrimidinase